MKIISIVISCIALLISAVTAWLTLFHKGKTKMTQPTIIFFGPDGTSGPPKIFLRTLLFSTARRGHVIENMYIKLQRGETDQNFNIWVYGDKETLARGSGLFVGKEGIACNHHFLLPKDGSTFQFVQGEYTIKTFVSILGDSKPQLLFSQKLFLPQQFAAEINNENSGVYFDWGPDSKKYHSHVDKNPNTSMSLFLKKGVL